MGTIKLVLPRGIMRIEVEKVDGGYQRVSRYTLSSGKFAGKTLTNRSELYWTKSGALKEADKFADQQVRVTR